MTILSRHERTDHLNLSKQDRENAPEKFKEIIPTEKALYFIEQVKRKENGIISTQNLSAIFRYAVTSALARYLGGDPKLPTPDTQSNLSLFFMHYFCWIFERASKSVQKQMVDRFCSEARSDTGVMPLFIEMYAAFTYLFVKNLDVDFRFGESQKRDWDLEVISDECTLSVEVKTVIYEAGIPIKIPDIKTMIESMKDAIFETYRPKALSLHVIVMPDTQLTTKQVELATENITHQIKSGIKIPANQEIILYFKFREPDEVKTTSDEFSKTLCTPDGGHTFIACQPDDAFQYYATLNYKNLQFNHGAIERQLRDAFNQLKGQPMQAAFIAVLGAHPLDYSTIQGTGAIQLEKGRLGNRLKQKSKGSSENIAAISFSLDPYTTMRDDREDTLAIQSWPHTLLTKVSTDAHQIYLRNFVREKGIDPKFVRGVIFE